MSLRPEWFLSKGPAWKARAVERDLVSGEKKKKEKNENQGRLEQSCVTAHTCSLSPDQSFPVRELLSPKEGNGFFGEKNG